MDANVVMRRGHGLYGLTDPVVQAIWRERRSLSQPPTNDAAPITKGAAEGS